ncbi:MAG: hypothetical protein FJY99_01885 [Candidatus Sericytochromatia bacterium]|nr:hypothetical protein [Candidatus Tanganyikabacteria bacterium]
MARNAPVEALLANFPTYLESAGVLTADHKAEVEIVAQSAPFLRLGEIVLGLGILTLDAYTKHVRTYLSQLRLGDYLVLRRLVTTEQVERAVAMQQETGRLLGWALIHLGYCDMPTLQMVLEEQRRLRGEDQP